MNLSATFKPGVSGVPSLNPGSVIVWYRRRTRRGDGIVCCMFELRIKTKRKYVWIMKDFLYIRLFYQFCNYVAEYTKARLMTVLFRPNSVFVMI